MDVEDRTGRRANTGLGRTTCFVHEPLDRMTDLPVPIPLDSDIAWHL